MSLRLTIVRFLSPALSVEKSVFSESLKLTVKLGRKSMVFDESASHFMRKCPFMLWLRSRERLSESSYDVESVKRYCLLYFVSVFWSECEYITSPPTRKISSLPTLKLMPKLWVEFMPLLPPNREKRPIPGLVNAGSLVLLTLPSMLNWLSLTKRFTMKLPA